MGKRKDTVKKVEEVSKSEKGLISNNNIITVKVSNNPADSSEKPRGWRSKIAIILSIIGVIAALLVVPEIRGLLGLIIETPTNISTIGNTPSVGLPDLHLNSIPYITSVDITPEFTNKLGVFNYSVVNSDEGQKVYTIEYSLVDDISITEGASFNIYFDNPIDLSDYKYLYIDITFGCDCIYTDFIISDISGNAEPVTLSPSSAYQPGISVVENGFNQKIKIPMENFYFLNTTKIVMLAFLLNSKTARGYSYYYICDIYFSTK